MQISQRRNELKQDITNNFIYNFHESNIKIWIFFNCIKMI
jgi:hypothetical protein